MWVHSRTIKHVTSKPMGFFPVLDVQHIVSCWHDILTDILVENSRKYLFCPFSRERMRKQESKDLLGLLLFIIYSLSKPSEGKKDSLLIEAGYKTRFIMQFSVLNIITLIAISVKADSKCLEIRKLCFTMLQTTVSEMIGLSNWCFLWS